MSFTHDILHLAFADKSIPDDFLYRLDENEMAYLAHHGYSDMLSLVS